MAEYGLTVTVEPATEPADLRDIKRHLRISDARTDQDVYLFRDLLPRARREVESYTGRALINQSLQLTLDCWPPAILLPRPPGQTVESVQYLDDDDTWNTVDAADYRILVDREPAVIELAAGESWPSGNVRGRGTIRVDYTAGYGADKYAVPQELRGCVLSILESFYRFPGAGELPENLYQPLNNWRASDEWVDYGIGSAPGIKVYQ